MKMGLSGKRTRSLTNDITRRSRRLRGMFLLMDVVQYPEFLALRLYEDNFIQFDGMEKEKVIDYVSRAKKLLESYGVRVELEGRPMA